MTACAFFDRHLTVYLAHLDLTHLTDVLVSGGDNPEASESDNEMDADDDKSAFGRLVLPDGHKDIVLSLVS